MDVWVDEFTQQPLGSQPQTVPGFFVRSTAPINIEQDECKPDGIVPTTNDVVESLYQNTKLNTSYTGLVIQIHGYNTGIEKVVQGDKKEVEGRDYVREGWQRTWEYLNQHDPAIHGKPHSFVYLGYRWPSESVPSSFDNADRALPLVLKLLFWGGFAMAAIGLLLLLIFASPIIDALSALGVILGVALAMVVATLFMLRIIVYFRDHYRANNFGVPDLVEFIRQLDLGMVKRHLNEPLFETVTKDAGEGLDLAPELLAKAVRKTWEAIENRSDLLTAYNDAAFSLLLPELKQRDLASLDDTVLLKIYTAFVLAEKPTYTEADVAATATYWDQKKRIRLTFVGHSMGGFVTTQVIRILSDVFDPAAIGDSRSLEKLPPSNVGRVFALGRLILISPDIPLSTIISGRTNFLRSSLRRFEEAYLFSNEGDLALRIASTTANYFSFPASTRTQGFRLGNVTVNLDPAKQAALKQSAYGIINLKELISGVQPTPLLDFIGVQTLDRDTRSVGQEGTKKREALQKRGAKVDEDSLATAKADPESIADLFTYLDCTEYRDLTVYPKRDNQEVNVLICEGQRSPLKFFNYATLLKAYVDFSSDPGKGVGVDVHGGYFYGRLSNLLIYRLAFLGFQGLLDSLVFQPPIELSDEKSGLPHDLKARLHQAQQQQLTDVDRRKVAVECLSWLCEKRKIQVAASPERYYVDVLGEKRVKTRNTILTQNAQSASPTK